MDTDYNLIIVGAGISGLNCALQLQDRYKILIIEKNERVGGRIYTYKQKYKNNLYKLEGGAGRISSSNLYLFNLLTKLDISNNDLLQISNKKKYIPIDSKTLKYDTNILLKSILQCQIYYKESYLKSIYLIDYCKIILGIQKAEYLSKSFGYNRLFYNSNAWDGLLSLKNNFNKYDSFYVFKQGYEYLLDKLLFNLDSTKVKFLLNTEFEKYNYSRIQNNFQIQLKNNATKLYCQKIILSLPPNVISELSLPYIQTLKFKNILKSIQSICLCRIYCIYDKNKKGKIWFEKLNKVTTDNELQYIIPINVKTGAIMISYSDNLFAKYWSSLYYNDLNKFKNILLFKLKQLFPNLDIPHPRYIKFFFWEHGSHYYKINSDSNRIIKNVCKPSSTKEIYICNDAFSSNQNWVEGSIKSSQNVIDNLLKKK